MVTAVGVGGIGSSAARLEKRLKRRSCVMGPPSSAKCWGHAATWDDESARHIIAIVPDMPPAARYQGCCKLVGSSHSLLPCRQLPAVRGAIGWSPHRICSAMSPATLPRC
ncbi:hypothetical protein BHM03_00015062 [Ensete ventricosum]|nr:hypothetical protein BHM03_00015062 [Ensete ventricosum]